MTPSCRRPRTWPTPAGRRTSPAWPAHPISTRSAPGRGPSSNYPSTYPNLKLEYTGGSNYLISVPPGQSADVQIFNPSFAPDSNDQNGGYSYHEDDSSLNNLSTTATDYSAMSATIFSVPTLSSDQQDTPISQEVFYPYNATCLYLAGTSSSCGSSMMAGKEGYYYFPTPTGTATAVDRPLPPPPIINGFRLSTTRRVELTPIFSGPPWPTAATS